MRTALALGMLLCAALASGCAHNAYDQSVNLLRKDERLSQPARITISDLRSAAEKQSRLESTMGSASICARLYGDHYILPSKPDYLAHRLASVSPENQTLDISLKKFETTEFCEATATRIRGAAVGAIASAVNHVPSVVSQAAPQNGDIFVVRIAGTVNGHDFDVTSAFDYSDVSYWSFPSESAVYRQRITDAITQLAREIVTIAAR